MQPERQIAAAGLLIGAMFVYPDTAAMLKNPGAVPGGLFLTGGFLGSIGVLFGTLLAFGQSSYAARNLLVMFWALVALAFGSCMLLGAIQSPGIGRQVLCAVAGLLPFAAFCLVIIGTSLANRPKSH